MNKIKLTYIHSRNIFIKNEFKAFIYKYFKDVRFEGFDFGYWLPTISISNWDEVKDILPKSYQPYKINGEIVNEE